jgi:hypothetical protein
MGLFDIIDEAEREAKRQRVLAEQQARLVTKDRKAKHERIAKLLTNLIQEKAEGNNK